VLGLNGQVVEQDKPLDLVANCAHPFCKKPIHFTERCLKIGNDHYCNEKCFVDWSGAQIIKAGTETLTI
jgi:hypothetical protein